MSDHINTNEKIELRKLLSQDLQKAQQQADTKLEKSIVKTLKIKLRNPCATFLDKISKIRSLNFVLEYIFDSIFFCFPSRYKLTYNYIPIPAAKDTCGKIFLGRMISAKVVAKILQREIPASNSLTIISMQVPEETYDINGKRLVIPFYNDPIITCQRDLPKNTKLVRFASGGVFDHCFQNALTGASVTPKEMLETLEIAHQELLAGNSIYVHCWAGKERSVVFVMCYLIKYCNLTLDEASAYVKKHRILARALYRLKSEQKEFLQKFVHNN